MKGHTSKNLVQSFLGVNYDADVFTSGGTMHTVVVTDLESGQRERITFTGKDARKRAFTFAEAEACK